MNKIRYLKFTLSILAGLMIHYCMNAQVFNAATIDTLSQYLYNQQYSNNLLPSYGAIKKSKGEDIFAGQHYFSVEPYFSHIAALGMLKSNHPDKCAFTLKWLNWYVAHIDSNGQTFNHYYKPDGTGETTCPPGAAVLQCNHIDAEDSDPALFWILLYEYYLNTNDLVFFTPSIKLKLENAAQFVTDSLLQPDHLSIAKRSYAIKYTMDNCEVYKGFLSLSNIEADIYNDTIQANLYLTTANHIKTAIQTLLFDNSTQLYNNYMGGATDSTVWYGGGITACVWPQLFEVDSMNAARSIHQRQVLNNNFDGTPNTDWTTASFLGTVDAFTWASIGYIFSHAGDTAKGYAQANYISGIFTYPYPYAPCFVADAAWAIMNMSIKYPANSCNNSGETVISEKKYRLYPNPSDSYINIISTSQSPTNEIWIYNLPGNIISIQPFSNQIDISHLKAGIYLIRFVSKNTPLGQCEKIIVY